jgi:hypothetical protein
LQQISSEILCSVAACRTEYFKTLRQAEPLRHWQPLRQGSPCGQRSGQRS